MATSPDQQHVQTFRSSLTDEVVNIPTFLDKTGLRIVLWSDIQAGFKNAESVRNDMCLVPFIKDKNFEQ
jgi:hypothetical protein